MSKQVKPTVVKPVEEQIAKIESEVTEKVASESTESVYILNWGTFFRRGTGWHGPGGFYGPGTPMAQECEEKSLKDKELQALFLEARQRHHDYHVFLYREKNGVLLEVERINYEIAMAREEVGSVKPLPDGAVNYFNVEKEKPKESKG